jgi:hypothetical protein
MVPAAFVSAVVAFLTVGVSLAQAAVTVGRSAGSNVPAAGSGATNVGLVVAGFAILAVVVGAIVYLAVADQQQETPVVAAVPPAPLSRDSDEHDQHRRAA